MKKVIIYLITLCTLLTLNGLEASAQEGRRQKFKLCLTSKGELVIKKRCRRPEVSLSINTLAGEMNVRDHITERAVCQAPFIKGQKCNKRRNLFYFYNKNTNACEQRSYCIPNVNTNIFDTLQECQEACVR